MATVAMGMDNGFEVTPSGRLRESGIDEEQRNFALYLHLTALIHVALPVVGLIAPIVMWLNKRESSRFIDDHGREAINFQISIIIWSVLMAIASAVVIPIVGVLTLGLGLVLWIPAVILPYAVGVWGMIMGIRSAVYGEYVRCPMTWRFIKERASA